MDISATWCAPCWNYTQTGTLSEVNKLLGKEGLDNTVVLFIEAESTNTIDQLYGITGSVGNNHADGTFGDWVEAIDYPIIDDASLGDLYEINYYPSLFKICPIEKRVYQINQVSTNQILDIVLNNKCMAPINTVDPAILRYKGTSTVCSSTSLRFPIEIINLGTSVFNQATITLDDGQNTPLIFNWSGSLNTYEKETIHLGPMELYDDSEFTVSLECDTDEEVHNNFLVQPIDYAPETNSGNITVEIYTDEYGFETYWEIRDHIGNVFAVGGNEDVGPDGGGGTYINSPYGPGAYSSYQFYSEQIELPKGGCYEFFIVDDFGDGLCCNYGNGFYKIIDNEGSSIIQGGRFTDSKTIPFSINELATSTEVVESITSFECYPNPASDLLYLEFESLTVPAELTLFTLEGKTILNQSIQATSNTPLAIDVNNVPAGMYLITLLTEDGQILNDKVVIQ